jgi:drug/metabolite transporter (DMT)-like permease
MMGACIKLGFAHYSLFELTFYRNLFGAVAIGGWAAATASRLSTPHWGLHLRRSVFGTTSMMLWFVALAMLPLSTATTLGQSSPLFVATFVALAGWWRGEPASRSRTLLYVAVAIGFAGVLLALRPTVARGAELGFLAGILSAGLAAMVYLHMRHFGRAGEPVWRVVFWFSTFSALVGLAGVAWQGGFASHSAQGLVVLAGVGGFALLGQLWMTRAFAQGSTLSTSILQYASVVFAAVLGWWGFGERLSWMEGAGFALIAASGIGAAWIAARDRAHAAAGTENALAAGRAAPAATSIASPSSAAIASPLPPVPTGGRDALS